jgi:hypothetical protein
MPVDELVEARYQRFRRMGVFLEGGQAAEQEEPADAQPAPAHHLDKAAAEKRETADQAADAQSN